MFIKTVFILVFSSVALFSCSAEHLPFQDKPQVGFKSGKTECLENFGDTIQLYFNGELSEEELNIFWSCFADSVNLFVSFTKGEQNNVYTAYELRNFLQRYFLGQTRVSDGLLNSLMQLKRVFIGGSELYFTKAELLSSRQLITRLNRMTVEMLPHIKLVSQQLTQEEFDSLYSPDSFNQAMAVLKSVNAQLGDIPQSRGEEYSFEQLRELLLHIDEITSPELRQNSISEFIKYVPLIKKLKVVFIGPGENSIKGNEWVYVFDTIYAIYASMVRLKYFINSDGWSYGEAFNQVGILVNEGFRFLEMAVERQLEEAITHTMMENVFDEMDLLWSWPLDLELSSIKETWRSLIDKVFTPREKRPEQIGLDVGTLQTIVFEFNHWHRAQVFINDYVGDRDSYQDESPVAELLRRFNMVEDDSPEEEVKRIMFGPVRFILDSLGRLQIASSLSEYPYDRKSLFVLNWQRVIVRLLVKAYARELDRRDALVGLTQEELGEVFEDFNAAFVSIGLANPDETKDEFVSSFYKLSALFMPRSNGDEIIDLEEGIEYTSFALSGVNGGEEFFKFAKTQCDNVMVDEEEALDVSCFRRLVMENPQRYFSGMLQLHEFFRHLPDTDQEDKKNYSKESYIYFLEQAVRAEGPADTPITVGDIGQGIILGQYIETYMVLFDSNRDGIVNLDESMQGFPVYKKILAELADFGDDEDKTEALYTYLLKYGEKPDSLGDKISFAIWMYTKWRWRSIAADRMLLVRILGLLAASDGEEEIQ